MQHLSNPEAFLAEVHRCLRVGGHLLVVAPVRTHTSSLPRNPYWYLRSVFYRWVPGVVRFYATDSLVKLVEGQGLTVVETAEESARVMVIAESQG